MRDRVNDEIAASQLGRNGVKKRTGMKAATGFPEGAVIVSMVNYKDKLMVATTEGIYQIRQGKAIKLEIIEQENDNDNPTRNRKA